MKKLLSLMLALTLLLGLSSVSLAGAAETYDLALITDVGTINDKSFNQGAWEGLVKYAEENGISHKYYQPKEQGTDAYLDGIQLAVEGGAKLIVTPGFLFEEAIFIAQDMYPDVNFVLVDGNPHNADYSEFRTEKNALGIVYAEEQSGFLAGYAVVKEGYTKLGFMGGMAVPAVIRFGYGFVQGAEYAAKEMGIDGVTINYNYTNTFLPAPEVQNMAAAWYNDGLEVIFACAGGAGNSVMAAAEGTQDKWVVGVDVDQYSESERVITSAMKDLQGAVYDAISAYYAGNFPGGESWWLDVNRNGVAVPMETSRFATFSQADYDDIYAKLVSGEIVLQKDTDVADASKLAVEITKVLLVE